MNLSNKIYAAAKAFEMARAGNTNSAGVALKELTSELQDLIHSSGVKRVKAYGSFRMGVVADVPWVACTHERFGHSASRGYFVVYLFSKDGKRVYLTIGVGAGTAAVRPNTNSIQLVTREAVTLRERCNSLRSFGFKFDSEIDLGSSGGRPRSYKAATSVYKEYGIDSLPVEEQMCMDFLNALRCFSTLAESEVVPTPSASLIPVSSLSMAILAKPFLILTGPSGTGKTLGAVQLAGKVCESECQAVVAVGADWTDNRHVVGFLNPLQTVDGTATGTPIYETTEILNLLLHANANPRQSHVLILDEMNLSHVERYFADFLSAMELEDKKKALKLHSAGMAKTREELEVPESIDFPENLFVIGTVNIDETTYMFSPKVLDRANVIEIHAAESALKNFLEGKSGDTAPEARDYGISFLDAARAIRNEEEHDKVPPLPNQVRELAAKRLIEIFAIMKRGRGEFGFRTGREVLAYLRTAHFLTPEADRAAWASAEGSWLKALDAQILQKILPKLHGSRTRLAPLLGALATYCATGTETAAMEHFPKDGNPPNRSLKDAMAADSIKFETSYQKLKRMIEVLVEEQFVSFIC